MKLFFHFAVVGFSNTYLIGPESGGGAILVDPGVMDVELLKLIEGNGYYIRHILVTHSHESHIKGLQTILKIYEAEIYGKAPMIFERITKVMTGGIKYDLDGIEVEALDVKGHAADHLVYRIQNMLFTGDILAAGRIGSCESAVERAVMLKSIQENLLPLPDNLLVFPGHGPPSTLKTERLFNPDLHTDQAQEKIPGDNGIVPEEEL
jgi:hydroxyacylglutathione hydrolase